MTNKTQRPNWLAIALFAMTLLAACGTSDGASESTGFQKLTPGGQILAITDFTGAGLKQFKEYDVTELPGANAAYYGFWTPPGDESADFELRFYPSHQVAVDQGAVLADEVTGRDAAVAEDDSTWKEGVRDRRTSGFDLGGGGGALGIKHADFAIYGNVVMLCQGRDSKQSLDRCGALIAAVIGTK